MAMPDIPMYVFTGFLESGKTKFIQQTLEDERFNTGERTLLLVFEEGEEEYDVSAYPHKEVYEQVLDYEDLSPELLTDLQKKYRAERVVVELNGMHLAADFYLKFPNGGAGKMSCALAERVRIRSLIHLDRQAKGGDFQRTEVATAVIEVLRNSSVLHRRVRACAAVGTAGSSGRQDGHTACAADRSRGQTTHKVWRQQFPGIQGVGGRRAKSRRDIGGVFAAVGVCRLIHRDINGIVRGGASEHPCVRTVKVILQCRCRHGKSRQHTAGGQQRGQIFFHAAYPLFLLM